MYPLHDIIPEAEWKILNIADFELAQTHRERMALLPHQGSDWLSEHIQSLTKPELKGRKRKLYVLPETKGIKLKSYRSKILLYISAMLAFRQAARNPVIKEKLSKRLSMVPTIIIDSLLFRFAEMPRGSSK